MVLGWFLMRHLPEKDRQLKEMMDVHLKSIKDVTGEHGASLAAQRVDFRESLASVMEHCQRELTALVEAVRVDIAALRAKVEERKGKP